VIPGIPVVLIFLVLVVCLGTYLTNCHQPYVGFKMIFTTFGGLIHPIMYPSRSGLGGKVCGGDWSETPWPDSNIPKYLFTYIPTNLCTYLSDA